MSNHASKVLLLGIVFTVGCGTGTEHSKFQPRLDALLERGGGEGKCIAARRLAEDAAEAGDIAVTLKALDADPFPDDGNVATCAFRLADAKQQTAALRVARMIYDAERRDQVLALITQAAKYRPQKDGNE